MRKIAINRCYGVFELSKEAMNELNTNDPYWENNKRDSPRLVAVIEKLGKKASGEMGELKIVEIPDDVEWTIKEYDGKEWVAEVHRTWS